MENNGMLNRDPDSWKSEKLSENTFKVDRDGLLESIFLWIAGISVLCLPISAVIYNTYRGQSGMIFFIALATLISSLFLYKCTEDFYLLDKKHNMLFCYFKFFGIVKLFPVVAFKSLKAVTIDCRKEYRRNDHWMHFAVVLISRTGKVIRVSDWKDASIESAASYGKWISEKVNCKLLPGKVGMAVKIIDTPQGIKIEFDSDKADVGNRKGLVVVGVTVILSILMYLFF